MFSTILSRCTVAAAHYTKNIASVRHCSSKINFDEMVKKNKVVVFIKGTPQEPRCGYSKAVLRILEAHGVKFDYYNVLDDYNLREGIKEYSDWPTIPQVFMNGEFIGGCDVMKAMHRTGELISKLYSIGIESTWNKEENKVN